MLVNVLLIRARLTTFKFLSESDNLSGLIGFNSHDDLNSLFDLRIAKNASALETEFLVKILGNSLWDHVNSLIF